MASFDHRRRSDNYRRSDDGRRFDELRRSDDGRRFEELRRSDDGRRFDELRRSEDRWRSGDRRSRKRSRTGRAHPPPSPPTPPSRDAGRHGGEAFARAGSPPWRDDDEDGHYVFGLGENLTPRYKILSKMGEGTFGRVLECWDRQTRELVAIKVVRSTRKYREAAFIEIDVLKILSENDRSGVRCVQIRDWFDYRNHICIVCEKLGPSLFDLLRRNQHCACPVDLIREFSYQLIEAVAYMHSLGLVHTDLKPENILLVSSDFVRTPFRRRNSQGDAHFRYLPKSSAIKLIDFGSAVSENQHHSSVVSTRHYRAPEVILNLGWSYPCDIWSIGCIIVELCTGVALFQTHDNLEHLAMMERVLGPLPKHIVQRAHHNCEKYFARGVRLNWPEGAVSRESIRAVNKLQPMKDLVSRAVESPVSSLCDLLYGLLRFDSSQRLTAGEALNHPFFRRPVY